MKKVITVLGLCLISVFWLSLAIFSWLSPAQSISVSERRPLKQMPEINTESILNTSFMSSFESYTVDQFPLRDTFRTMKALTAKYIFGQKDNNDIYVVDGHAAKLDFPINDASISNAANKLQSLYETYLQNTDANIYFSMVPDKNYFLAKPNGYPTLDYDRLVQYFCSQLSFAEYVDIFSTLSIEDYYRTDSHWKQEQLTEAVQVLANAMSLQTSGQYDAVSVPTPFYGVYYGQSALPLQPDTITYLKNPVLDRCTVYHVESGKTTGLYDLDKLNSNDPYEMFLSGASPILVLENPSAADSRELIVFRDSYGSSLIPLLAEAYSKITIVDTRYVVPAYLPQFVDFQSADDVLFLYCTTLLNSSSTLK